MIREPFQRTSPTWPTRTHRRPLGIGRLRHPVGPATPRWDASGSPAARRPRPRAAAPSCTPAATPPGRPRSAPSCRGGPGPDLGLSVPWNARPCPGSAGGRAGRAPGGCPGGSARRRRPTGRCRCSWPRRRCRRAGPRAGRRRRRGPRGPPGRWRRSCRCRASARAGSGCGRRGPTAGRPAGGPTSMRPLEVELPEVVGAGRSNRCGGGPGGAGAGRRRGRGGGGSRRRSAAGGGAALRACQAWSLRGPHPQRSRASRTAGSAASGVRRGGPARGGRPAVAGLGVVAAEPFVGGLAADAEAAGGLGDREAGGRTEWTRAVRCSGTGFDLPGHGSPPFGGHRTR